MTMLMLMLRHAKAELLMRMLRRKRRLWVSSEDQRFRLQNVDALSSCQDGQQRDLPRARLGYLRGDVAAYLAGFFAFIVVDEVLRKRAVAPSDAYLHII